jgi:hypothetical protein
MAERGQHCQQQRQHHGLAGPGWLVEVSHTHAHWSGYLCLIGRVQ